MSLVVLSSFLLLILGTAWFLRLVYSARVVGVDPEWLRTFSPAMYRPMMRLLSEHDVEFLKTQPGYRPGMEKQLRRERQRLFRTYLQSLARDFNRLDRALRLVLPEIEEDQPELAKELIFQKIRFFWLLGLAHLQLKLYALGLGTVDVSRLLATVEVHKARLQAWLGIPAPVAARWS